MTHITDLRVGSLVRHQDNGRIGRVDVIRADIILVEWEATSVRPVQTGVMHATGYAAAISALDPITRCALCAKIAETGSDVVLISTGWKWSPLMHGYLCGPCDTSDGMVLRRGVHEARLAHG